MARTGCPICLDTKAGFIQAGDQIRIACLRCGSFTITGSALAIAEQLKPTNRQIANASGWLNDHPGTTLHSQNLEGIFDASSPTIAARADRILQEIARNIHYLGDSLEIPNQDVGFARWLGISWSVNPTEFSYLLETILQNERQYVYGQGRGGAGRQYLLTPAGYVHLEETRNRPTNSQIGFCAMWFDDSIAELWSHAIEPAIAESGYQPIRIDKHQHNNRIDDEIVAMIRRSKFVVADFTQQRGGVYFEAGLAVGLGLPVIWTCNEEDLKNVHFDTRQYNFLLWTKSKWKDASLSLRNRIVATLGPGTWKP